MPLSLSTRKSRTFGEKWISFRPPSAASKSIFGRFSLTASHDGTCGEQARTLSLEI